jgi:hypothetical protein
MRLSGRLLKIEPYSGTMKGEDGLPFDYAGTRLHVLDGIEIIKVKIPKEQIASHGLVENTDVDLAVSVQAKSGGRGIPYLTTTLIGSIPARLASVSKAN